MNDKLVYDLSQETEGVPNVFIRKDWLNIMDNQNGNYQGNQSVIDTSQISNSNKFMNYREAYLAVPLLLTAKCETALTIGDQMGCGSLGLKNWFGTMIHSMTLDYNGSTVIQQTNFTNIWNSFKLLTSLSYDDIALYGSSIGFYPDTPDSFLSSGANSIQNNILYEGITYESCNQEQYVATQKEIGGNKGLTKRIKNINFEPNSTNKYDVAITSGNLADLWLPQIYRSASSTTPYAQVSVMAVIYLRHLSSFFNFVPLLKGAFMKFTLNFNTTNTNVDYTSDGTNITSISYDTSVLSGGVNPLLIPNVNTGNIWLVGITAKDYTVKYNISVGSECLNKSITGVDKGKVGNNIYLYVPAYSFNPQFYDAYIQSSPKRVVYTDIYQYSINNVEQGTFTQLISNGIPNIKSVLLVPFLKNGAIEQWQSPFDPAGSGTTAPLFYIKNFQVQVAGQNMIYNNQQYTFEEFNNQLLGCNGVNGGLTDGLTSGLIDFQAFKNSNCYYYVNVERMLPSEKNVPKSVQISGNVVASGTGVSTAKWTFLVFVEYENSMSFDLQTGARIA